jgi:hypothetical protein
MAIKRCGKRLRIVILEDVEPGDQVERDNAVLPAELDHPIMKISQLDPVHDVRHQHDDDVRRQPTRRRRPGVKRLRKLRPPVAADTVPFPDVVLIALAARRQFHVEDGIQKEPQIRILHQVTVEKQPAPNPPVRVGSVAFVQLEVVDVPLVDDEIGSDLVAPLQELGQVGIDLAPGLRESSGRESRVHHPQPGQQAVGVEERLVLHALSPGDRIALEHDPQLARRLLPRHLGAARWPVEAIEAEILLEAPHQRPVVAGEGHPIPIDPRQRELAGGKHCEQQDRRRGDQGSHPGENRPTLRGAQPQQWHDRGADHQPQAAELQEAGVNRGEAIRGYQPVELDSDEQEQPGWQRQPEAGDQEAPGSRLGGTQAQLPLRDHAPSRSMPAERRIGPFQRQQQS